MAWELNGNSNTNPASDFLGTSDGKPLVIKTDAKETVRIDASGNVGVGTANPSTKLHVLGPGGGAVVAAVEQPAGMNFMDFRSAQGGGNYGTSLRFIDSGRMNAQINSTADGQLRFATNGTERLFIDSSGHVSVGTAGPRSDATLVSVSAGVAGFFEGNVEVTGSITVSGDIFLTNSDYAEDFDAMNPGLIEPGMVMVIEDEDSLKPCHSGYDRKVVGVVSGAGDMRPGIVLDRQPGRDRRMTISLLGKVFCRIDAAYAPIDVGDLLTTSPTLGCAMKVDDAMKAVGAVIGKALRPCKSGQGMIPILIALQ